MPTRNHLSHVDHTQSAARGGTGSPRSRQDHAHRHHRPPRPHRTGVRGASLVEFVVVFPVALLLVLAVIQCSFLGMGKLALNHVAFMAARHGATAHADPDAITAVVVRGLVPFHQDNTQSNDAVRIVQAHARAQATARTFLQVERLSPSELTFQDFGIDHPASGQRQIPNDNLRWRQATVGAHSGVHIQDANLLKIKVTYGQELKVPLMATLFRAVLCRGPAALDPGSDCARYHAFGRMPLVSFAVVEMQSPARMPSMTPH